LKVTLAFWNLSKPLYVGKYSTY